jgi:hypothetical protein
MKQVAISASGKCHEPTASSGFRAGNGDVFFVPRDKHTGYPFLQALRHAVDLLRNHSAIRASGCLRRFHQEGHAAGSLEPSGTSKRLRICGPDDIGNHVRLPSTLTSPVWTMSIESTSEVSRATYL